jgi:hypothetical protein
MQFKGYSSLLEAFFIYDKAGILDQNTKAALRLCNKNLKNLVDATVTAAKIDSENLPNALNALIKTEWHSLKELCIMDSATLQKLPSALFLKFSRLEALKIEGCTALTALPAEIGALSHLNSLDLSHCPSLRAFPSSLGQLTSLEKFNLTYRDMTVEGFAPLQHLTGLTSLKLTSLDRTRKITEYPDFTFNLTSLKELRLRSFCINKLPDALGNLTNLESLNILLEEIKELPESIGNLNALKVIDITWCIELTALPESLDDLLWRKAQETGESKMDEISFEGCYKLEFSSKMEDAFEALKKQRVSVILEDEEEYEEEGDDDDDNDSEGDFSDYGNDF